MPLTGECYAPHATYEVDANSDIDAYHEKAESDAVTRMAPCELGCRQVERNREPQDVGPIGPSDEPNPTGPPDKRGSAHDGDRRTARFESHGHATDTAT